MQKPPVEGSAMAKRIAMFNHKGGVGKTLTAYHVGWTLAEQGHQVLLVDGDSQVNLTAIALGTEQFDTFFEDEATKQFNIKSGVAPVFEGQPRAIAAFECPRALGNERLFVLPGHLDLQAYEAQLSLAQETGGTLSVLRNLPGALSGLVGAIEDFHQIKYTIIDLNPGLGAINQSLFLSADGFVVPTNPDPFSNMALLTLADRVVKWNQWRRASFEIYKDTQYPLKPTPVMFLGTITSRFNKHSSKAAKKFDERIRAIDQTVRDVLYPQLRHEGMALPRERYQAAFERYLEMNAGTPTSEFSLARIPDFQSLAQIASQHEVPVSALSEDMLRDASLYGNSLSSALKNVGQFRKIFECISLKVEMLIDD
jgi:chromosome partitioning protein